MEESVEILHKYEDAGLKEVWFTPHIMEDIPNTTQELKKVFSEVVEAYDGNLRLHLAAEYMLDSVLDERLNSADLLLIGSAADEKFLLVETSCFHKPLGMDDTLEKIKSLGITPVLAHPERYVYMNRDDYKALKASGVLFQLNLLSASGHYGREAANKASWLLKNGMADKLGTDIHSRRMLNAIKS